MSLFSQVKNTRLKRSKFDLSHERKLSLNMGKLVPILNQEVLPGDSFNVNTEIFLRMSPLLAPIMHRVNVFTHFFYVPNRIVWDNWNDFIFGGLDGEASPQLPFIEYRSSIANSFKPGGLPDYMGIPIPDTTITVPGTNMPKFNSLPFRAYNDIFNEYYRDQNLVPEAMFDKSIDGDEWENAGDLTWLKDRAWEKDYFTSCLPFAQKGPAVELPADVSYKDTDYIKQGDGTDPTAQTLAQISALGFFTNEADTEAYSIENINSLGITIADLRNSVRLQEWYEKMARGGSRAKEALLNMFGILSSDARLDRPEYLGGGKSAVTISEVLNTAGDSTEEPNAVVGDMAGHGIAVGANHGFRKKMFEEHGHVIGIMSVLPKTAYQQGVHRNWTRQDKFDYFWKQFANIGEQEVKMKEVFKNWASPAPDDTDELTFGYQSRYAEYKYNCDSVHGDFRENLDYWHMGRKFASAPTLNEDFINADPTNRIFAVTDEEEHKLYAQVYHRFSALRPLPYFGTPRL